MIIPKMAASIYATPPPDLSSEDTALSDVSNTSSTNAISTNTHATATNNNSNKNIQHNTTTSTTETTAATVTSSSSTTVSSNLSPSPTSSSLSSLGKSNNNNSNTMTNTCETKSSPNVTNSSGNKNKRTIADVFKDRNISTSSPTSSSSSATTTATPHHPHHNISSSNYNSEGESLLSNGPDNASAMAAVAAAANAAMQMQFLEALNDAAKKRRKQHNPTRMDEDKHSGNTVANNNLLAEIKREQTSPIANNTAAAPELDYEDRLAKMFLPKSMEHLKETFEMLQQKQQENISDPTQAKQQQQPPQQQSSQAMAYEPNENYAQNPYHTFCKECGENFENEFKLSLHMLQEHNSNGGETGNEATNTGAMTPMDILASVNVKMERPETESPVANQDSSMVDPTNVSKEQQEQQQQQQQQQPWLRQPQMPPMGFPFPPEAAAAAALQAGGYLPLLAVPGFPGVDGLQRPPMRIFNPEAFCELCNKEFCNKYFLKTHKANKHGIYDPVGEPGAASGSGAQQNNTLNAMNQMFQLQMQQQQQHLQQQHQMQMELAAQQQQQQQQQQISQNKLLNENQRKDREDKANISGNQGQASSTVYCDICSKRFTNIFAMRRHRVKVHEQNATSQRNSPSNVSQSAESAAATSSSGTGSNDKQFQMPDGFRQDFGLEQEEVSFTPQPRKLSPQSQQQARDANFAHDKLKRLGVINPEAFCELCCKEYCNKYFLRTHKWKRHGIFIPPEENENLAKLGANWPFMNMAGAMPAVNLMMASQRMISPIDNSQEETAASDQQPNKRIKLENPDSDVCEGGDAMATRDSNNDENQENRNENNQNNQNLSVPSTPEPQKPQTASPETVMGLQNLQKLQSMIQQLNDLNGKRPVACHLCGREMENQYALQAHIMAEHNAGGGMEGMAAALPGFPPQFLLQQQQQQQQQQLMMKQSPPGGSPGALLPPLMASGMGALSGGELRCTPCDREFSNLPEFQKHITEVHLLGNNGIKGSPKREGFVTPDRPVNSSVALAAAAAGATRPPYTLTPTSSYCEICNKELCNKYFMKTHMQRMHGIEIENGAQIGGVVCNICNKELCSKYFLRVHKHNTHGIIDDGSPLPQPRQNGVNSEVSQAAASTEAESLNRNLNVSPFGSNGSEVKSETPITNYSDNCPLCSKRFRSPKWLRSHLLNDHGASGMEKLRELEQQFGSFSKSSSPTLKIPNGSNSAGSNSNAGTPNTHPSVPSPAQLAQALQNLNAQQLLQQMPKPQLPYKMERNIPSPPRPKEYQCSLCSFTTPYYAFLFIHERTHSIMNTGGGGGEEQQEQQEATAEDTNKEDMDLKSRDGGEEDENERDVEENVDLEKYQPTDKENSDMMPIADSQPTNLSMRTPSPQGAKSPLTLQLKEQTAMEHDSSYATPPPRRSMQSAACSPIFNMPQQMMLQEMAEQFGKTASYAVPREMSNEQVPQMQAFVIEEPTADNRFVPAIIYLPVRERITGSMKLSFNLTPV
ncbi:uncharacterized protein isoform X2 [Musca autumnalis]|uniref:uncharacterized protein isoform X2 n=1 Tax=Musca autumnalis TaxID=221902 RepID=UPI003CF60669